MRLSVYIRNLIVVHGSKPFNSLVRQDPAENRREKNPIQRTTQRHLQNCLLIEKTKHIFLNNKKKFEGVMLAK